jgi:hypothetical protein
VDPAQGHVAQEGVVWLVLGRHQEELAAFPELAKTVQDSTRQPSHGGRVGGKSLLEPETRGRKVLMGSSEREPKGIP